MNDIAQMIRAFNEFKNSFKGDAQAEVMKLVQSGKISQAELNQLQQVATELQKLIR